MKPIEIDTAAQHEIDEAMIRSATQFGPHRRDRFADELDNLWVLISQNPGLGETIRRTTYRRFTLVGYPYYVVYSDEENGIKVVAFGHTSRRSNYWLKRIRNQ